MVTLMLVKALGARRLLGWAVRIAFLLVELALFGAAVAVLYWYPQARDWALGAGILVLVVVGVRGLWRHFRRKPVHFTGERTIDGKVVPDKLAIAGLEMPPYSSSGEFILRGLPDYGKDLLKLDSREFEYLPEQYGQAAALVSIEPPIAKSRWVPVLRAGLIAACVFLVMQVVGVGLGWYMAYRQDVASRSGPAPIQDAQQQTAEAKPDLQAQPEQSRPVDPHAALPDSTIRPAQGKIREAIVTGPPPVVLPPSSAAPSRNTEPTTAPTEVAATREPPSAEPDAPNLPSQSRQISTPASMFLCIDFQGMRSCNQLRRQGGLLVGSWPNGDVSHMEIEHFSATDVTLNDSDSIASNGQTVHMVYKGIVQGSRITRGTILFANTPIGTWKADWEP